MVGYAIQCKIVTPDRLYFDAEVDYVVIPGVEGEIGILPDHAPIVTILAKDGVVQVENDGKPKKFRVEKGVAEMRNNIVSILTDQVEEVEEVVG